MVDNINQTTKLDSICELIKGTGVENDIISDEYSCIPNEVGIIKTQTYFH